jgi:hypothetical protein
MEPHADRAGRVTLGSDKGYDAQDFVAELREVNITPHVAQNISGRRSAIDGRTTHHPGYAVSLRIRKRIEEAFGWAKTVAGLRKARAAGRRRSIGSSPSRWPPTTSSVYPSYLKPNETRTHHTTRLVPNAAANRNVTPRGVRRSGHPHSG